MLPGNKSFLLLVLFSYRSRMPLLHANMKTPPFQRVNVPCHFSFFRPPLVCVRTNVTLPPPLATVWAIYLYAPYRLCVLCLSGGGLCVFSFSFFRRVFSVISILLLLLLLHLPSIEWRTSQNTLKSIDDNFYLYYCCCRCYFQMIGIIPSP